MLLPLVPRHFLLLPIGAPYIASVRTSTLPYLKPSTLLLLLVLKSKLEKVQLTGSMITLAPSNEDAPSVLL